jgi:predicted CoA-binding protein
MTTEADVKDFLGQRTLAVVGVSRGGKGFGDAAYKELRAKGYKLFPVHPHMDAIEGQPCYASLSALPEKVGGVLIVVPPSETEKVVREALESGIRRIWMQQGAESPEAIKFCQEQGASVIHNECILMFAEPTAFFHRLHRWVWGLMGKLPR